MHQVALKLIVLALLVLPCAPARAQRARVPAKDFDRVAAQAEEARGANRIEEAIKLYREAVSLRPRWAEGWFNLGTLLYDKDAFADAAVALGRAAALSPNVGTTWALLGLCEFKLGRHADALEHIRRGRRLGVSADPQFRRVMLYHEGLLLVGKGDFERAQETLGQLSQEGVESDELFTALGLAVLRLRFSELLAGDAALREVVARAGHAEHLAAQKKFDEAQREYERLAADFPKGQNVHYARGRYLLVSHDDEGAVAELLREIENNPRHLLAHLLVADTRLRQREFAAGLPYAEEAAKLSPRLPLARYLLGSLLLGAGQTGRAVAELETAARLMPDEPKIFYALSNAYLRAGRKSEAARALAAFARLKERSEGGEASGHDATEGQASGPRDR
jgi:tetratricopeptide (TPR) repeat protein